MTAAVLVALALTPGVTVADDSDCATCHENLTKAFGATIHGRIQDFETEALDMQVGCVSCHGEGTEHMDSGGEADKIRGFGPDAPVDLETEVCMNCHRSHELNDWVGSEHSLNGVGCADCHTVHKTYTREDVPMFASRQCMSCHPEITAAMNYPSHHPVREGKMSCVSCHNPHSATEFQLNTHGRLNDLCTECHQKQD